MDITKENFMSQLPKILSSISEANFIAVDTEFTALLTSGLFQRSYFDSVYKLYQKEKKNLENVAIVQIGLSIFKGRHDSNSYCATTYNFYICPHSLLGINDHVTWQLSSLELLKLHGFNFEEWVFRGISCLNPEKEEEVRKLYSQVLSKEVVVKVPYEVNDKIFEIRDWLRSSSVGESTSVRFENDTNTLLFLSTLVSYQLSVLADFQNGEVRLTSTETPDEAQLAAEAQRALEVILKQHKGFVTVFEALVNAKVPLIVHNGVMDLLLMYKQFSGNLPQDLEDFKNHVHGWFPLVYDTKQLAHLVRIKMKNNTLKVMNGFNNFLTKTDLETLKKSLEDNMVVLHRPSFYHSSETPKYGDGSSHLHEAGYDAFCTGYCFLHLSHIYAMFQFQKIEYQRPLSARELTHAMKQWSNEIPTAGSSREFMYLDRFGPSVRRFAWLVVETRDVMANLSPERVASALSSFKAVDIVRRNRRSVLVAPARPSTAQDIIRALGDSDSFTVSRYRAIKHSKKVRSLACGSFDVAQWLACAKEPVVPSGTSVPGSVTQDGLATGEAPD